MEILYGIDRKSGNGEGVGQQWGDNYKTAISRVTSLGWFGKKIRYIMYDMFKVASSGRYVIGLWFFSVFSLFQHIKNPIFQIGDYNKSDLRVGKMGHVPLMVAGRTGR